MINNLLNIARTFFGIKPKQDLSLGQRGEKVALNHIKKLGYKILGTNVKLREGELDIIARDKDVLVFIEVKTRKDHRVGHPFEAVDIHKQRKLTRLALAYQKQHGLLNKHSARFDVAGVTWPETADKPTIEYIKNAFDAIGSDGMF